MKVRNTLFYLVADCKTADNHGYGKSDDEDTTEGTEATGELAHDRGGLFVVANRSQGQQAPPDTVVEGPVVFFIIVSFK